MKVGDKVVCVDDSPNKNHCGCPCSCKKGVVYVIAEARVHPMYGNLGLKLLGLVISHLCGRAGTGYIDASRFRLLDELKQEAKQRQEKEQRV